MKMTVNYLNFVFRIEVKAKSKYRILNFVFQFIKKKKRNGTLGARIQFNSPYKFSLIMCIFSKLYTTL